MMNSFVARTVKLAAAAIVLVSTLAGAGEVVEVSIAKMQFSRNG